MRRERIVLWLPADAGAAVQWRRFGEAAPAGVGQGSLEELAAEAGSTPVQVLVPGEQIFITRLNLPTHNRQRLRKAIPFALEDQLLDEVESLHFALGQRHGDSIEVAVVARALLDGWLERLRQAGLVVERLLPDVYALAPQADCWVALWENTRLLLRPAQAAPLVLDNDSLGELLPLLLEEAADERPGRLCLWDARGGGDSLPLEGVELERRSCEGLLHCLSAEALPADAIDLLQGDYSRREQLGKLWRPWRLTAALALTVFGLQVAATAYDNSRLRQQSQALRAQAEAIYRQTFPAARKVVNPRVQMQRRLDALRAGGKAGQGLLELLARSGEVLRNKRGLVLRSIRYKQGELDLEVEVASLQQLDELKQQLAREAGMQVDIQSAAAKGSKVRGRLRLKGKPA